MKYRQRTIASLDLGTNTLLLMVSERSSDGTLKVIEDRHEVVRLGQGLEESGIINDQAIERTLAALIGMKEVWEKYACDSVYLCATAALREAKNAEEVRKKISDTIGIETEILAKNEEVRLTYRSVLADLDHEDPSMVVDIGGGSTEIAWGLGSRFDGGRSLSFGTVKLLESFMKNNDLEGARAHIESKLERIPPLPPLQHYYGTAGSYTQLAALIYELEPYSAQTVDMKVIKKETLETWIQKLSTLSLDEIQNLPGVNPKRADVLLSGALIVETLMRRFGLQEFVVRDRGIRFGKTFDVLKGFVSPIEFRG
ncbi:MAG: hypothetical protein KDD52_08705 [Bdellovibrionales bacterium]|nr:hypothetical protein [Bdellovibrionales bacterium]